MFSTEASFAQLVLVVNDPEWSPSSGAGPAPENLNVKAWMPTDYEVRLIQVDRFPGTTCHLRNGYDICFLDQKASADVPLNTCLLDLFSIKWHGNVIVFKRGVREFGTAISITAPEIALVSAFLQR